MKNVGTLRKTMLLAYAQRAEIFHAKNINVYILTFWLSRRFRKLKTAILFKRILRQDEAIPRLFSWHGNTQKKNLLQN